MNNNAIALVISDCSTRVVQFPTMAGPYTDVDDYDFHRQLAISDVLNPNSHSVANSVTSSPISVPDGWIIQQVPRYHGSRIDTYYIEPETGRKFRSRYEITRYLNAEEYKATRSRPSKLKLRIKKSADRMMITCAENLTPESKQIICAENATSESKWITSNFTLPEDWYVERVPRKSGNAVDKYYHDPATGRRFRSLKDVERYLTEGIIPTGSKAKRRNSLNYHERQLRKNIKRKMIACSGKLLDFDEDKDKDNAYQLVTVTPTSSGFTSTFKLPDGWIVEEVPRRLDETHIDRYYYEPGTQKMFRSLTAVLRHLAEQEENSSLSVVQEEHEENNLPLSKAFKLAPSIKNYGSYDLWKKSISRKEQCSSSKSPPNKINWVIPDTRGETWNAFIGDTPVPDSMKQQWGRRFTVSMNNSNYNAAISGCTGMHPRLTL